MDEPNKIFSGDTLEEAINTTPQERPHIVEGLIYEKSALMLYADDGVGKSVLCLQACLQMTVPESKLFGEFEIPTARNVLYFQMERAPDESFERIRHMRNIIPYDKSKLGISLELQGTDLMDRESNKQALEKVRKSIKTVGFQPDVMAFDPIYSMVSGDLAKSEACNAVTGFFRRVQADFPSTIFATSHTNRGIRDPEQFGKRVGKDMYGNRFLSAFFTGSYHVEAKGDGAGSKWTLDKNSQKNLEKKFELVYDSSNYCSWLDNDGKNVTKKDRMESFLRSMKNLDKAFSLQDIEANSQLSTSMVRRYQSGYLKEKLVPVHKSNKGMILYKYAG